MDPRTGLDDVETRQFWTLPGLELPPLGCPARSQSLYPLLYPGTCLLCRKKIIDTKFKEVKTACNLE
jgi:hypothetical protein